MRYSRGGSDIAKNESSTGLAPAVSVAALYDAALTGIVFPARNSLLIFARLDASMAHFDGDFVRRDSFGPSCSASQGLERAVLKTRSGGGRRGTTAPTMRS
jgi:hypothetical protein